MPLEARGPTPKPAGSKVAAPVRKKVRSGHRGIRCPRCGWRPRPTDRWSCVCGHAWNTFETRGVCPGCTYQWRITQCLQCHEYSPHEDWYEPARER